MWLALNRHVVNDQMTCFTMHYIDMLEASSCMYSVYTSSIFLLVVMGSTGFWLGYLIMVTCIKCGL